MYISVLCHSSSHNRYKGFGICTSSASGIHNYQSNILVHFGFCDFESRVTIIIFFCLRLGVAFRETIFSLTVVAEKVRKLKKKKNTEIPDGETNLNLSAIYLATPLIALQASITGAILISWPSNITALFVSHSSISCPLQIPQVQCQCH
jgi:hypothetical protein